MKRALLAAALTVSSPGIADASDRFAPAKGDPGDTWTGPYIGGQIGYGWARSENSW